jgi:hypothetical protein
MRGMTHALKEAMNTTNDRAMEVAQTIMGQIGFWNAAEFGVAKKFALTDECGGVRLHLGGAVETRGWRIGIVLTAADTYRVSACKVRGLSVSKAQSMDDVYCDSLAQTIGNMVFGKGWAAR